MPDRFQRPINGRKPVEAEGAECTNWARAPKGGGPVFRWGRVEGLRAPCAMPMMAPGCGGAYGPADRSTERGGNGAGIGGYRPVSLMPMEGALLFLGRLAHAKAAPSTAAFCPDQGLRYGDLRRGEPKALVRFAMWGGIELERLLHQTCRRISETEIRFLGVTLSESMLVLTQSRVCPACPRDDMAAGGPPAIHCDCSG